MLKIPQILKKPTILLILLSCIFVACFVLRIKFFLPYEKEKQMIIANNVKSLSISRYETKPFSYLKVNLNNEAFTVTYSEDFLTSKSIEYKIKTAKLKENQNDFFYTSRNIDYSSILINTLNDIDFFGLPRGIGRAPMRSDREYKIEYSDGKEVKTKAVFINGFYRTVNINDDSTAIKLFYLDSVLERMLTDLFGPNFRNKIVKNSPY